MKSLRIIAVLAALLMVLGAASVAASAGPDREPTPAEYWTAERVASAIPRDLVIDHRGLGYLRLPNGDLQPYGHTVAAVRDPVPHKGKPGGSNVSDADWPYGGAVQWAAGRLLYAMDDPATPSVEHYVCSGTVVTDGVGGRSIVLTAAHCVYDDVVKAFATNVIFIPNQDGSSSGTDYNCLNDPIGCWAADHGVVDINWTTRVFPDNIPWDYAYYVMSDSGSHQGAGSGGALDVAAGSLPLSFTPPALNQVAFALGYSYSADPNFRYCSERLGTYGSDNYWLGSCRLSGGSSGGPWIQPMDTSTGSGPVFSVNSWGFQGQPGMAGPKLAGTSASAVFALAKTTDLTTSDGGFIYPTDVGTTTTTTTTSTSTTTTTTPTTTTTAPSSLVGSSINEGKTWTAIVTDTSLADLTGSFDTGATDCLDNACSSEPIPKRTGSVVFTSDEGETVTVYKP